MKRIVILAALVITFKAAFFVALLSAQEPTPKYTAKEITALTKARKQIIDAYKKQFSEEPGLVERKPIELATPRVAKGEKFEWISRNFWRELKVGKDTQP